MKWNEISKWHLRMRIQILVCRTEWTWTCLCQSLLEYKQTVKMTHSNFSCQQGSERSYSTGSPTIVKAGPFQVKLLTPSIRVCAGCRGGYNRDASTPSDYVILVCKEQHLYYNVVTGRQQPSSMMNVYYHTNLSCPRVRCLSLTLLRLKFQKNLGPNYCLKLSVIFYPDLWDWLTFLFLLL